MELNAERKIIFFAPHQDDELVTMGIEIAASVREGADVYVVLCTDGSRSRIRESLSDGSFCPKCNTHHLFPLSPEEFVRARDTEFFASCKALGVKKDHIIIPEKRITDGSLSMEKAKGIITRVLDSLGYDSAVCTILPTDPSVQHHDHHMLGLAALQLKKAGLIDSLVLAKEPYLAILDCDYSAENPELIRADGEISAVLENAVGAYSLFDPSSRRYAIGYHSITSEFDILKRDKTSYRHTKI